MAKDNSSRTDCRNSQRGRILRLLIEAHGGWRLPEWISREAGERLREAAAAGQPLPSRELEFALDAAARRRRLASHAEWTSPEWREGQRAQGADL